MSFFQQNMMILRVNWVADENYWSYSFSSMLTVCKSVFERKWKQRLGDQLSPKRVTSRLRPIHRWKTAQSTHPDVRVNQSPVRYVYQHYEYIFLDCTKVHHEIRLDEDEIEENQAIFERKFTSIYSPHPLCWSPVLETIWITFLFYYYGPYRCHSWHLIF